MKYIANIDKTHPYLSEYLDRLVNETCDLLGTELEPNESYLYLIKGDDALANSPNQPLGVHVIRLDGFTFVVDFKHDRIEYMVVVNEVI